VYYTLNEKNIFALAAQYKYQDEDPFYQAIREQFAFTDLFPVNETQEPYDVSQTKNIVSNKVEAKLDYYYVTGPKSNLNFTLGTTQSHQNFDSRIFQTLDNNDELNFTADNLVNDVRFHVSDLYAAMHYKVISGIFTFNPGVTLHQFHTSNEQLGEDLDKNLTSLLPDMYINVQLKKSENIRFNYRMQRTFTDVTNFAEALVLNNYNAAYSGNAQLESALNHNLSLNFFSFNMFNFTNIFGSVAYSKRIDALKSDVITQGINRISTTINSPFSDESLTVMGRYERTFGKIKGSFRGNVSWSKTNNIRQGLQQTSESLNQNYTLSLGTQFRDVPNIELGYRYGINDYNNQNNQNVFYTQRPFVRFDAPFLKSFIFTADYDYYSYSDKNNTLHDTYGFLKADLTYQQKDSPWEFGIKGTNLLNTEFLNRDNQNDFYFTTSTYAVQPR
jgi:hypothetical protein